MKENPKHKVIKGLTNSKNMGAKRENHLLLENQELRLIIQKLLGIVDVSSIDDDLLMMMLTTHNFLVTESKKPDYICSKCHVEIKKYQYDRGKMCKSCSIKKRQYERRFGVK